MAAAAQSVSIQFESGVFKVTGWKPPAASLNWPAVFKVYAGSGDVPAMLGTYAVENGSLIFRPQFPIAPGVRYTAVFQPPGGTRISKSFDGPKRDTTPSTRVVQIYPTADVLPSNLLRVFIYFSAPMSRDQAARHLHVVDENGRVLEGVESVLLRGEELWDPAFQRLTMTFDPGRIKRDLTSNRMIGPPIAEGKRYTLIVDREWPDARGVPLVEGFRKVFRGGPAFRSAPDPKQWRITAPKAGSAAPLVVDFPTAMNYPLLLRMIQVAGPRGMVEGTIEVQRQETQWRFTPRRGWEAGEYKLVVETGIEDLAGNHIGQLFDFDNFERVTERIETKTVSVAFTVRGSEK